MLSQVLPSEVGYPPIVQHGGEIGSDWLILERIPGVPLSRAWPNMTMQQRRRAVSQLADRLKVIHSTICPRLDGLGSVPQLLDSAPTGAQAVTRLLESIDEAARLPNVDPAVMGEAADLVTSICSALDPFDSSTIVHGDLTFENIMWNGTDIAAMLDFEFARPAPAVVIVGRVGGERRAVGRLADLGADDIGLMSAAGLLSHPRPGALDPTRLGLVDDVRRDGLATGR